MQDVHSVACKNRVLWIKTAETQVEMQVADQLNWSDRSLLYLCRSFDQLETGEEYSEVKPAIHIGFLCFTPFKEHPEFYATYKLMNVKSHHVYNSSAMPFINWHALYFFMSGVRPIKEYVQDILSVQAHTDILHIFFCMAELLRDKFILSVVDLTKIELATEEDKQYEINYWASLFKAKTWEELRMIAKNNEFIQEATETLFELNADELVRQQCLARQDYYRGQAAYQRRFAEQEIQIHTLTTENEALSTKNDALIAEKDALLSQVNAKDQLIKELQSKLAAQNN